jgi:integrase
MVTSMSKKCVLDKLKTPHKISLYRNGDNPNIYYYFRFKNIKYQGSTGTDNIDISRNKVNEIFFDISKGLKVKGNIKGVKFETVVKKFLEEKSQQRLSPRTLSEYKRQSKFLIERFRGSDLKSLCSKKVYLDYCDWRRKYYLTHENKRQITYKRNGITCKGRMYNDIGNVPINRECRLLVSILRFSKEYLEHLKGIDIPSFKILPERRREEILTKDEYLKLENYWMKRNPYYWMILSFLNNTGIRYPNELNKICWSDVNFKKSYVLIRDRKSRKSKDPLNTPVPLVGRSLEIIKTLKSRENIPKGPDDYVFVNDNGIQIKNIRNGFKGSLKKCGISNKITMYGFRHLFTTRMVKRSDIPLPVLSSVLGHTNTVTLQKHYLHLNPTDIVRSFRRSEERKKKSKKDQNKENPPS